MSLKRKTSNLDQQSAGADTYLNRDALIIAKQLRMDLVKYQSQWKRVCSSCVPKIKTQKSLNLASPTGRSGFILEPTLSESKFPVTLLTVTSTDSSSISADTIHRTVHQFGGDPPVETIEKFMYFIQEREKIRNRKEKGDVSPWTNDPTLAGYKFTNVKREHDFTSRWMREHWTTHRDSNGIPIDHDIGTVIFNCAMFRYFGTIEMGKKLQWCHDSFHPEDLVRKAMALRRQGYHVFTRAYCRPHFNAEMNPLGAMKCYMKVCHKYLNSLWKQRHQLSHIAQTTRSWRAIVEALRSKKLGILGFGGTGFMAKEIVMDALHTPALETLIQDRDDWCPCGPGARRGLNRLFQRPTSLCLAENKLESVFISEMKSLLCVLRSKLPSFCSQLNIELHDIQFQLCEFDKYCRCLNGEGSVAPYSPRGSSDSDKLGDPPLLPLSRASLGEMEELGHRLVRELYSNDGTTAANQNEDDEEDKEDDEEDDNDNVLLICN